MGPALQCKILNARVLRDLKDLLEGFFCFIFDLAQSVYYTCLLELACVCLNEFFFLLNYNNIIKLFPLT